MVIFCIVGATALFCLVIFIRWVCYCWRNFLRFLLGLACLAVLILLGYAEENWRGKQAWEKFKHEWEAKGEKFDFASFIPPPVPDDQNFATTPIVASCYVHVLDRNGHRIKPEKTNVVDRLQFSIYRVHDWWRDSPTNGYWLKETLTDLKGWQNYYLNSFSTNESGVVTHEFPVSLQPQPPAADVLLALSKYEDALKELAEASRLPASRFPVNYDSEDPTAIILTHLAALKRSAQTLQLRALAELEAGQSVKACEDVVLILRLTEKVRSEPMLITHLVRIAMAQIAVQVIYEGLAAHRWSDAELTELSAEIDRQNIAADYKFAMRGEMAWQGLVFNYLRKKPEYLVLFCALADGDSENLNVPLVTRLICRLIPPGWFYQNQVNCARLMTGCIIPIADETNRTFSVKTYLRAEDSFSDFTAFSIFHYLPRMLTPGLSAAARKFAFCQNALNLSDVAIALERYRLVHREYPEMLDTLVPQFIEKLPHDIINGQPLHYRRTDDGQFVLYSVGWNEADDGGVVGFYKNSETVNINIGDWVWHYSSK
jgi:hypothetical protein